MSRHWSHNKLAMRLCHSNISGRRSLSVAVSLTTGGTQICGLCPGGIDIQPLDLLHSTIGKSTYRQRTLIPILITWELVGSGWALPTICASHQLTHRDCHSNMNATTCCDPSPSCEG